MVLQYIFLILFLTFPLWYGVIMYRIGRYGLPFEIRRRARVDRRQLKLLKSNEDSETEVYRA